jgi:predicted ATPase
VLTAGQRTAPPRQRTLAATLEWSYQLLPEWEQRLLRHLAVFRGGFTMDAAIAVAGGSTKSSDVVSGIGNLIRKSLVATEGSAVTRWRLLETTRVYARSELDTHGETQEALKRHAMYFRDLAARSTGFGSTVLQHSREIDNVRATLEWGRFRRPETQQSASRSLRCTHRCGSIYPYCQRQGSEWNARWRALTWTCPG